jgi:hypothetical protein
MTAMSKKAINRLFIGGIVAIVAGNLLMAAVAVMAFIGGGIQFGGPMFVSVNLGSLAGPLGLAVVASAVISAGSVAAVGAWIGALFNTWRLDDKTWFGLLLVLGLVSFGLIAMIAYVIAGPDGTRQDATSGQSGIVLGA